MGRASWALLRGAAAVGKLPRPCWSWRARMPRLPLPWPPAAALSWCRGACLGWGTFRRHRELDEGGANAYVAAACGGGGGGANWLEGVGWHAAGCCCADCCSVAGGADAAVAAAVAQNCCSGAVAGLLLLFLLLLLLLPLLLLQAAASASGGTAQVST